MTAGGALLAQLKRIGVDYVFANSGTDFPPIIEGLAEAAANDIDLLQGIVIPMKAPRWPLRMAITSTGRSQAVMATPM
ncbi:hypothetical protein [Paracoccus sediminilitoris]|uniref:hypothetical protein n=1 Tax=Paracoccus sediminilitoris TaxID=2202419 RepID=UPI001F33F176|nr:hypothetical protein [Paracoccus sediminilitoris]